MIGHTCIDKYTDPRNLVFYVQIFDILVPNVLIDLGMTINVITWKTMEKIGLTNIHLTPTILELVDQSKIDLEGLFDDVIIFIYSLECLIDFIVLQPKNPIGCYMSFIHHDT